MLEPTQEEVAKIFTNSLMKAGLCCGTKPTTYSYNGLCCLYWKLTVNAVADVLWKQADS